MNFPKSSFQSVGLKRGFLKPSLIATALPCKMRSDFKSFLKLVLFDSNKGKQHFVSKTKPSFQNHLIWNHSKKKVFGFRKQILLKIQFSKLASISTHFKSPNYLGFQKFCKSLPHSSSKISKLLVLKSFGICKMFSSKWFQTPHTHYFKTSFVQNAYLEKFIKWFEF